MEVRTKCLLLFSLLALTACGKTGGKLTLDPDFVRNETKGSSFAEVNQGGRALLVEAGKTVTTGVHGYASVQTITAGTLKASSGGTKIILSTPQALSLRNSH